MAAKQPRPVIGINADLIPASKTLPVHHRLNIGYSETVYNAGGLPIVLPTATKDWDLDLMLDQVDGMILSGGLDLDPRRQGWPMHSTVAPMALRREEHDFRLLRRIMERKIPLLAIGVGMQMLNVALGGTLFIHIPAECPKAIPHFDNSDGPHRHMVNIEPKSLMDDIYGGGELRVNSAHHMAVRTLGKGLRIGARCPDETIEAIESTDPDWFCIGVQWHPEAETAAALDLQLFDCFIQASLRAARPTSEKPRLAKSAA
ncbi:MAG: gamma-glutamyl-gamma-aminobutyrate hydrolase family protein [Gemmataceae bacterium]|nr:gamma-glutamyl-gamma-aminobutyrate hydrolase family protein [Gemmataceae bacterium]